MSIKAYQQAANRAEAPRDVEWRAFSFATAALVRVVEENGLNASARVEAINKNLQLWSLMADDCAQPENQLPAPLRAQLISLALWVDRHSREALRQISAVQDMIDVNRSIMEGLSGKA